MSISALAGQFLAKLKPFAAKLPFFPQPKPGICQKSQCQVADNPKTSLQKLQVRGVADSDAARGAQGAVVHSGQVLSHDGKLREKYKQSAKQIPPGPPG